MRRENELVFTIDWSKKRTRVTFIDNDFQSVDQLGKLKVKGDIKEDDKGNLYESNVFHNNQQTMK